MRKTKTKKAISLVLTLMFALSIFAVVPAQEAEAATSYTTQPVRTFASDSLNFDVNTVTVKVPNAVLTADHKGAVFQLDMNFPAGYTSIIEATPGQNVADIDPLVSTDAFGDRKRNHSFEVTVGDFEVEMEYSAVFDAVYDDAEGEWTFEFVSTDVPGAFAFNITLDGEKGATGVCIPGVEVTVEAPGDANPFFGIYDQLGYIADFAGDPIFPYQRLIPDADIEDINGAFRLTFGYGEAVGAYDPDKDLEFSLNIASLRIPTGVSGDVVASFSSPPESVRGPLKGTIFDAKDVVVARVGVGEVIVSVTAVNFITDSNVENTIANLRFTEEFAGAMGGESRVELKLPRGFYWDSNIGDENDQVTISWLFGQGDAGTKVDVELKDPADLLRTKYRTLVIWAPEDMDSSRTSRWQVVAGELGIIVDPIMAAKGDVVAAVTGRTVTATPSELTVARYGDYVATSTALSAPTLLAGKTEQKLGSFEIREEIQGSLIEGRTIALTLPQGAKWIPGTEDAFEPDTLEALIARLLGEVWWVDTYSFVVESANAPTLDKDASTLRNFEYGLGDGWEEDWMIVDAERRTIRTTVTSASSHGGRGGALVVFKDAGRIAIEPTFRGELVVEVGGTAGAAGEIVLGNVVAPVVAEEVDPVQIIAGQPNQELPNIVLTESVKGAAARTGLTTGIISLQVPDPRYATFSQRPTAEVTDGDMVIERIWMSADRTAVNIQVVASSDVASTIEVSDLMVTLDRAVPYGDFNLQLGGDAIIDDVIPTRLYFLDSDVMQEVKVATVVDEITPVEVMMWIGSTTYTIDGVAAEMDVAPFIENDRTFVPVRFVAEAFGAEVDWEPKDGLTETVTVEKGDIMIEIEIGSNVMIVTDGDDTYTVMSDVAAQIVNDRTYLPIRAVGEILGAQFDWGPKETLTEWVSFTYWKQ